MHQTFNSSTNHSAASELRGKRGFWRVFDYNIGMNKTSTITTTLLLVQIKNKHRECISTVNLAVDRKKQQLIPSVTT